MGIFFYKEGDISCKGLKCSILYKINQLQNALQRVFIPDFELDIKGESKERGKIIADEDWLLKQKPVSFGNRFF